MTPSAGNLRLVSFRRTTRTKLLNGLGLCVACAWIALAGPAIVHAGGLELTAPGARGLGRGGAMQSSAVGSDALRYNPARLALTDRFSLGLDLQLQAGETCFDREPAGTDVTGTTDTFPKICNQAAPAIIPQLLSRFSLGNFGVGLGVIFPAGLPGAKWGDGKTGKIKVDGQEIPSPARYTLLESSAFAAFPTLGIGWGKGDFRIGGSFGWGIFILENQAFSAGLPGETPSLDARSALGSVDAFVPRISLGLDYSLGKGFSLSSVTTWTDDIRADSKLYLSGRTGGEAYKDTIEDVTLTSRNGWESGLSGRYAAETWDIELDLIYQANARNQEVVIDIPDDARIEGVNAVIDGQDAADLKDAQTVGRRWLNQWVVRAGSELSLLDWLRGRLGVSYESNGVEHGFEAVDNLPLRRVGLHFGLGFDVSRWIDINLAYARIFQPDVRVKPEEARLLQSAGIAPGSLADDEIFINAGSYTSSYHSFALSVVMHPPAHEHADDAEDDEQEALSKQEGKESHTLDKRGAVRRKPFTAEDWNMDEAPPRRSP